MLLDALSSLLLVLGPSDAVPAVACASLGMRPAPAAHAAAKPSGALSVGASGRAPTATGERAGGTPPPAGRYVCPMHPEVVSDGPGVCPKCNMTLKPTRSRLAESAEARPAATSHRGPRPTTPLASVDAGTGVIAATTLRP